MRIHRPRGLLALDAGYKLPIQVLMSAKGFYIGTADDGGPVSRESLEYWTTAQAATSAMDSNAWTQYDL